MPRIPHVDPDKVTDPATKALSRTPPAAERHARGAQKALSASRAHVSPTSSAPSPKPRELTFRNVASPITR